MKAPLREFIIKFISVLVLSGLAFVAPAQFHHHSANGDVCLCGIFHITHDTHHSGSSASDFCNHHHSSEPTRCCEKIIIDKADILPDDSILPLPSCEYIQANLSPSFTFDLSLCSGVGQSYYSWVEKLELGWRSDHTLRAPPAL